MKAFFREKVKEVSSKWRWDVVMRCVWTWRIEGESQEKNFVCVKNQPDHNQTWEEWNIKCIKNIRHYISEIYFTFLTKRNIYPEEKESHVIIRTHQERSRRQNEKWTGKNEKKMDKLSLLFFLLKGFRFFFPAISCKLPSISARLQKRANNIC